jgi:hypothetical protein
MISALPARELDRPDSLEFREFRSTFWGSSSTENSTVFAPILESLWILSNFWDSEENYLNETTRARRPTPILRSEQEDRWLGNPLKKLMLRYVFIFCALCHNELHFDKQPWFWMNVFGLLVLIVILHISMHGISMIEWTEISVFPCVTSILRGIDWRDPFTIDSQQKLSIESKLGKGLNNLLPISNFYISLQNFTVCFTQFLDWLQLNFMFAQCNKTQFGFCNLPIRWSQIPTAFCCDFMIHSIICCGWMFRRFANDCQIVERFAEWYKKAK